LGIGKKLNKVQGLALEYSAFGFIYMLNTKKQDKVTKTVVLVFGTFDILHPGHRHFFKQARKLSKDSFLVASVARDANVKRIKGGKPLYSEKQRLRMVKNSALVDKAVLGAIDDYLGHILSLKPNIIALGHDQKAYTLNLKQKLETAGLKVKITRLKPYKRKIYRSSLYKLAK
jgi:FAD synthetase